MQHGCESGNKGGLQFIFDIYILSQGTKSIS